MTPRELIAVTADVNARMRRERRIDFHIALVAARGEKKDVERTYKELDGAPKAQPATPEGVAKSKLFHVVKN